jgi:hypothetical protein
MGHALYRARVLERGIRKHHAGHVAWVGMVIEPDDVAAERMAHENEWPLESRVIHELTQISRGSITPSRVRSGITPANVRPVVPA